MKQVFLGWSGVERHMSVVSVRFAGRDDHGLSENDQQRPSMTVSHGGQP